MIQQHEWNKGCTIGGNVVLTGVDVCMNIMLRGAASTAEDLVSVTADK
ncbi:hypothetical protein J2W97_002633 [Paenibacillus jamilae]|nr:hypothetical protein [Paenibacillus polymyxa]AUS25871.1 hypothetical protein C1A50_1694 [Paenibacillus polymyxa]MDN4077084.1 hypothetical protein [Paenibacillus polymyxa]MDP9676638.1 hypothetical protein [Paenibacillus jamilae]